LKIKIPKIPIKENNKIKNDAGFSLMIWYQYTDPPTKKGMRGANNFAEADKGIGDPKTIVAKTNQINTDMNPGKIQ
jgi:hypothetical protein